MAWALDHSSPLNTFGQGLLLGDMPALYPKKHTPVYLPHWASVSSLKQIVCPPCIPIAWHNLSAQKLKEEINYWF